MTKALARNPINMRSSACLLFFRSGTKSGSLTTSCSSSLTVRWCLAITINLDDIYPDRRITSNELQVLHDTTSYSLLMSANVYMRVHSNDQRPKGLMIMGAGLDTWVYVPAYTVQSETKGARALLLCQFWFQVTRSPYQVD
jgi:hypothetical protein